MAVDLELHFGHIKVMHQLLNRPATEAVLSDFNLDEDEWTWLLLQSHAITLQGLLDRVRRMTLLTVRTLIRSYDQQALTSTERQLLSTIDELRKHTKKVRDPIAHGLGDPPNTGPVGVLLDPGFWEIPIARGGWPEVGRFRRRDDPRLLTTHQLFKAASDATILVLAGVNRTLNELDGAVDWQRVRLI